MYIDNQLRQRWNSAAAAFLAAELETGNTSVELAATSRNDENKIVYCRNAWTAYDAVVRLRNRIGLDEDERADIEIRLVLLKEKIEGIKPWGKLAREPGDDGHSEPPLQSKPRLARFRNEIRRSRGPAHEQETDSGKPSRAQWQPD